MSVVAFCISLARCPVFFFCETSRLGRYGTCRCPCSRVAAHTNGTVSQASYAVSPRRPTGGHQHTFVSHYTYNHQTRGRFFCLPWLSQNQTADNGVQESPEVTAMLAKLEDALDGNLEPSEWGGSSPTPRHVQHQQRPGGHTASDTRSNSGESGGWDGRRQHNRGAGGTCAGAGNERCVLEDFTQCSKSHLWKLMMSFYDRKGVESWSQVWVYCSSAYLDTYDTWGDGLPTIV